MAPPAEPLRSLPVAARPLRGETIGSFLTRLAYANSMRVPYLLTLAGITGRPFTPATDDTRGWSATTPHRIAALAGHPLPALAAAIPALAGTAPAGAVLLRACGYCAATRNITTMVIICARPHDYLCTRHQQWLRGSQRPLLTSLPEIAGSQRRHDEHTRNIPGGDVARAHEQARGIISQWLAAGWHPALTQRWQDRHRRLTAAHPGPPEVLADVTTHPEMLAIARLLLASQRAPGTRPGQISASLGFGYPSRPHPRDPLQLRLSQSPP